MNLKEQFKRIGGTINEGIDKSKFRFPHIVEYLEASAEGKANAESILQGSNKKLTERFIDELTGIMWDLKIPSNLR